ncbi:uncharacterized protein LOC62_04G005263 [Vanrija pseudolonga]|uniref:Uncharacterized protein n=1 Tax=Vanrija pseudolonga TaxID=143232 RepID=A0AAF0Y890_9TREE|nr:hypothetical protein LOC62_04G005263 [Vanrija pseudolonga]
MPAVIDHTTFPHLIGAIFASAQPASLVVLRCACRSFKARADALLLLAPVEIARRGWKKGGVGVRCTTTGEWIPLARVDILTADLQHDAPRSLDGFTSLRTLRRVGSAVTDSSLDPVPGVRTLVDFYDLHALPQSDPEGYSKLLLPFSSLERYVVHLRADKDSMSRGRMSDMGTLLRPHDLVVVLHAPQHATRQALHTILDATYVFRKRSEFRSPFGRPRLTVVGFADLERQLDARQPSSASEEEEDLVSLVSYFREWRQLVEDFPTCPGFYQPVRFVSMAQWLDELGDDRRGIEGVWVGPGARVGARSGGMRSWMSWRPW